VWERALTLLTACFMLGLLFEHEDGSYMVLRNVDYFHGTTRRHIPEDITLYGIQKYFYDKDLNKKFTVKCLS
jgi:hypothetical protein